MSDTIVDAFLKRYSKVYDPEANDRALLEKELLKQRKEARKAEATKPACPGA